MAGRPRGRFAGPQHLLLATALVACGKGGADSGAPPADYFLRATIDGIDFEVTSDGDPSTLQVAKYDSAWPEGLIHAQSFQFGEKRPRIKVQATGLFESPPDQDSKFQVFHRGSHEYGTLPDNGYDDDVEVEGVNVTFWDVDERDWQCTVSRGDQANSTFEVLTHDLADGFYTEGGDRIWGVTTGEFNCTLYSVGGSTLELEGGTFRALTIVM